MIEFFANRKLDDKKYLPSQIALTGDGKLFAVFNDETDEWTYVDPEKYELWSKKSL